MSGKQVEIGYDIMFPKGVSGASENKRNNFLYSNLNSTYFDWEFQKQFAEACNKQIPKKEMMKASEETSEQPRKKKKETKKRSEKPRKQQNKESLSK